VSGEYTHTHEQTGTPSAPPPGTPGAPIAQHSARWVLPSALAAIVVIGLVAAGVGYVRNRDGSGGPSGTSGSDPSAVGGRGLSFAEATDFEAEWEITRFDYKILATFSIGKVHSVSDLGSIDGFSGDPASLDACPEVSAETGVIPFRVSITNESSKSSSVSAEVLLADSSSMLYGVNTTEMGGASCMAIPTLGSGQSGFGVGWGSLASGETRSNDGFLLIPGYFALDAAQQQAILGSTVLSAPDVRFDQAQLVSLTGPGVTSNAFSLSFAA